MKAIIYSVSTGKVIRLVDCPEADLGLQANEGEAVLIGDCCDISSYIENSAVISKAPKPTEHHVFDYTTKQWIDPRTPETEWPLVRAERDRRLLASDWTQLPDVPIATKQAWAVYRQQLRDITEQPDPFNIVWPTPPT